MADAAVRLLFAAKGAASPLRISTGSPMNEGPGQAGASGQPVRCCIETDTMAIELRPRPRGQFDRGGAGIDLVIHYAPDAAPWLREIEHASVHPEHIAAARRCAGMAA
jgi:hypothetical protein